jgi:hypothetical protein
MFVLLIAIPADISSEETQVGKGAAGAGIAKQVALILASRWEKVTSNRHGDGWIKL